MGFVGFDEELDLGVLDFDCGEDDCSDEIFWIEVVFHVVRGDVEKINLVL